MKATLDLGKYQAMMEVFQKIVDYKRSRPGAPSDGLFYEQTLRYYQKAFRAKEEGKLLVAYDGMVPTEIFYAMDVVPFYLDGCSTTMCSLLRNYEEFANISKAFGLRSEVCTGHITSVASTLQGWFPQPDVLVWTNTPCENMAKGAQLMQKLYDVPFFFLDTPFGSSPQGIEYFAREMEGLIQFFEERTGRRLDWDRLAEALSLSQRAWELHREIYELRKAVPHPLPGRRGTQAQAILQNFLGSQEAVVYLEALRDEARERVDKGVGYLQKEKFRLIAFMDPPNYGWKFLDWMEKEHGAVVVSDPYNSRWGEFDWDFSQPLLTLSRRFFNYPAIYVYYTPLEGRVLDMMVEDALSYRVDGAIYWAFATCRQCAFMGVLKPILAERAGIPTVIVDCDLNDPSYVSDDEVKNRLEGFLEQLADRKG